MVKSTDVKGKTVLESLTFEAGKETFEAFRKAEEFLQETGYVTGSMCGDEPIGFAKESEYGYVAKWWNITTSDRKNLSGVMVPIKEFRDGSVRIDFFEHPNKGD